MTELTMGLPDRPDDELCWEISGDGATVQYESTLDGIFMVNPTGGRDRLANFRARITGWTSRDNGAERLASYSVTFAQGERRREVEIPLERFLDLRPFAMRALGPTASVGVGHAKAEHLRAALQLSAEVEEHTIFTQTGWREVRGRPVYLHAGGAIGAEGRLLEVDVELGPPLRLFALPDVGTGRTLRDAVRASLNLVDLAPRPVMTALLGATYRAVVPVPVDFSVHLVGPTGAMKSSLAAVVQCHFGSDFRHDRLPGSWSSTVNANERLLHDLANGGCPEFC
jgi:hypothetical protein